MTTIERKAQKEKKLLYEQAEKNNLKLPLPEKLTMAAALQSDPDKDIPAVPVIK